jgi:hypothetical protein
MGDWDSVGGVVCKKTDTWGLGFCIETKGNIETTLKYGPKWTKFMN